jgi:ABC-type amino acid transport substrate-binding protein
VRPDGTADGFSVDLLKTVVSVMGREIRFEVGPWNELKEKLATGLFDVLPLVGYSEERDAVYDFTVPYLIMHGEIFVRKENKETIRSLADLKDKEVVVMKGDNVQEWAVNQHLGADLILTTSFAQAFQLLASGKHDAVLAQKVMGLQLIKQLGLTNITTVGDPQDDITELKPTRITTPGFEQKFCFAVANGNRDLLAKLNEGLAVVLANGTYDRLYQKWFEPILPPRPVPLAMLIKKTLLVLLPIIFLLILAWLFFLKREVARKTQSLRAEIMERQKAEEKKIAVIAQLQRALDEIKTLRGILPLCSFCKKIRDDQGYWEQVDVYIHKHAGAQISHSICPDCLQEHYPVEHARMAEKKNLDYEQRASGSGVET